MPLSLSLSLSLSIYLSLYLSFSCYQSITFSPNFLDTKRPLRITLSVHPHYMKLGLLLLLGTMKRWNKFYELLNVYKTIYSHTHVWHIYKILILSAIFVSIEQNWTVQAVYRCWEAVSAALWSIRLVLEVSHMKKQVLLLTWYPSGNNFNEASVSDAVSHWGQCGKGWHIDMLHIQNLKSLYD